MKLKILSSLSVVTTIFLTCWPISCTGSGLSAARAIQADQSVDAVSPADLTAIEPGSDLYSFGMNYGEATFAGFCSQCQRELKKAIKRARHMSLMPFVG